MRRLFLRLYQCLISPALHLMVGPSAGCRFEPTCSRYMGEAVARHGTIRGGLFGVRRLCRCHPFSKGGDDPVPSVIETRPRPC